MWHSHLELPLSVQLKINTSSNSWLKNVCDQVWHAVMCLSKVKYTKGVPQWQPQCTWPLKSQKRVTIQHKPSWPKLLIRLQSGVTEHRLGCQLHQGGHDASWHHIWKPDEDGKNNELEDIKEMQSILSLDSSMESQLWEGHKVVTREMIISNIDATAMPNPTTMLPINWQHNENLVMRNLLAQITQLQHTNEQLLAASQQAIHQVSHPTLQLSYPTLQYS